MSGLIILTFIIYHILHYTAQVQYINFTGQSFVTFEERGGAIARVYAARAAHGWRSLGILSIPLGPMA